MLETITDWLSENSATIVQSVAIVVGIWVLYLVLSRYGHRLMVRIAAKGGDDTTRAETLWSMVRRILVIALGLILVLMLLSAWNQPIAPLLAVGSVIGVALGFGAQDLVKDVIAGFFILAEDQYRIGDVITIAGATGVVEDIRPRVTVLRDLDGNVHYVPNGQIEVTSNLTQRFAQVVLDIGIAYKESVDRALEVLGDELTRLAEDPEWSSIVIEPPQILGVDQLGDSAVVIRGLIRTTAAERWMVKREALRRVKNRFDAEDIEIPFPHRTIYMGDAPAEPAAPPAEERHVSDEYDGA